MTYSQFYAWLCNENLDNKVRKYFSKFWKMTQKFKTKSTKVIFEFSRIDHPTLR